MTPEQAYIKCEGKINKKLEPIIIKSPAYAYYYSLNIIEGRWIEAEDIIATNSGYAYLYALNVIKGRWIEAENIISTDPYCTYLYALNVIKGKLPEPMHNAMLLHADLYAKKYLNYIEFSSARRIKS